MTPSQRIKKLQRNIKNPLLVRNPNDLFYLTGHYLLDGGFLFISKKHVVLFGGFLEQVSVVKNDFLSNIVKYMSGPKTLELDNHISLRELGFIEKYLPKVKLKPISSPLVQMRVYKDAQELSKMKAAYLITAKVFELVKKELRKSKGITEKKLAEFIRLSGLRLGSDDISFPTIVASGANAAVPHHVPTTKKLVAGESIILDFGFKVDGYCSDFSRTIFIKSVPKKLEEIYVAVEGAYKLAVKNTRSGMQGKVADDIARTHLAEKNLEQYFIHSLGHGTGIEVHESPSLHGRSEDVLQNGMVFSIEPGVYIPKLGGVRIEDLVYLEKGKPVYFKKVSTNLKDMII